MIRHPVRLPYRIHSKGEFEMLSLIRVRAAFLAAPLLAIAPALTPASATATSAAAAVSNCTYYNNAQHTVVVGQFGYDCCNNPVAWGRKSSFSSCGGCFICFPPPP